MRRWTWLVALLIVAVSGVLLPASVVQADAPKENVLQIAFFRHSGYCLTDPQISQNGGIFTQDACHDPSYTQERFQLVRTCASCQSYYLVDSRGRCMTVAGASILNGIAINHYTCTAGASNQWMYFDASSTWAGYYRIRFAHSNKCAAVWLASLNPGAEIRQFTCSETAAHEYLFFRNPLT